ncbi:MAG: hypothetical protein HY906_26225 [Deltaproteobacteria bacterium]|nr:hypothetical protein [Deltaproteobacteria bacterium]
MGSGLPGDRASCNLSLIDWGLLLLNPTSPAKRASVPTKLAEFFAAGVRPAQFGWNPEISDWVRRAGSSGLVLRSVDPAGLDEAAAAIATTPRDEATLKRARDVTAPHFSLEAGVERYDRIWKAVLGVSGS